MSFWIREHFAVEDKIAPMKRFHPETVEVEDFHWDVASFHTFEERIYGLLVVVRCEACAEPKTERPAGNFSGLAS